jgi:2-iminoacetate synthase
MATTSSQVDMALAGSLRGLDRLTALLSPAASKRLEELGQLSQAITQQRFGKVIRLFAPLYLSNECINNCAYCGFSRDNPILRVTLEEKEVQQEAQALADQGFRHILLVAGEHPKFVSNGYLEACIRRLAPLIPSLSLEVGPMEQADYQPLVRAGAEGLVVYQETYDTDVYQAMHTAGPKKDFDWRLDTPERAYGAGFRRLGIGALFGLADWRVEAISLAAHTDYLLRKCWKSQITVSFPRLRPCAGAFEPMTAFDDRSLVQLIAAFRICFPDVGQVLSTREPASLRDGLIPLGITTMSAGSHTEPGGYTGAGQSNLHQTTKGRIQALEPLADSDQLKPRQATGQFDIADHRSPAEMAEVIRSSGYEPVWKDWDAAILKHE